MLFSFFFFSPHCLVFLALSHCYTKTFSTRAPDLPFYFFLLLPPDLRPLRYMIRSIPGRDASSARASSADTYALKLYFPLGANLSWSDGNLDLLSCHFYITDGVPKHLRGLFAVSVSVVGNFPACRSQLLGDLDAQAIAVSVKSLTYILAKHVPRRGTPEMSIRPGRSSA